MRTVYVPHLLCNMHCAGQPNPLLEDRVYESRSKAWILRMHNDPYARKALLVDFNTSLQKVILKLMVHPRRPCWCNSSIVLSTTSLTLVHKGPGYVSEKGPGSSPLTMTPLDKRVSFEVRAVVEGSCPVTATMNEADAAIPRRYSNGLVWSNGFNDKYYVGRLSICSTWSLC